MTKIKTRSPYFLHFSGSLLTSVNLDIYIYTGDVSSVPVSPTYTLSSTAINEEVTFEIAELVKGYTEDNFNGDYSSENSWVRYVSTRIVDNVPQSADSAVTLTSYEGYGYFEDGANPQINKTVLLSNDIIIANDKSFITFPVTLESGDTATINFYKDGEATFTETKSYISDSSDIIQYSTNSVGSLKMFESLVALDGGVMEAAECVEETYDDYYEDVDVDYIEVVTTGSGDPSRETFTVKEIEECKYDTYKLTFKNKYGAWQDLWFFKRSDLSLKTESSEYMSNLVSNGSYDTFRHQYTVHNKNGLETLKMSSGYYPESYNEVFRQLSLSEQVYIEYKDQTLPVNLKGEGFTFKQQINDKLINYNITVDFAFNKINNIR